MEMGQRLGPLDFGTGTVERVSKGEGRIKFDDVLVVEAWLASGQCNMNWNLAKCLDANL